LVKILVKVAKVMQWQSRQLIERMVSAGRNRTFNLLFGSQTLKMNDFNEFPIIYECTVRRF